MLKIFHIKVSEKIENLFVQIFKFVIVGGTATIIDWAVYYVLYNFLHIQPLIANILSFSVSVIYNYVASVKWVFDVNQEKSKKRMFIEFMIFSIIGLLLSELLLWIFIDLISINAMISKIIATAIVMVFNFITRKIFLE
ncbi:MAG: GtrA family protein [Bacilli bacterium]|nr:GtrA family protein [Bacilli bacterium]